jgi:TRAP-type mannitol/chloroaromatic compound transport system substrate-binding protein
MDCGEGRMSYGRRQFLASVGAAATAGIAAPAIAQTKPEVEWTVTSSFNSALDFIYGGGETMAKAVSDLTDGRFKLRIAAAGEIAPAGGALDAVASGKADAAHTALAYAWSQEPSFIFATSTPFGMNARQHSAWLAQGGGSQLIDELLADRKALAFPAGNTGAQMGGWFRKELRSLQDLQGLKMRVGGFAGKVFQTLGANPVAMPRESVYDALQSGSLDMFEWVGPYDDEKFGQPIAKVAPNYYYPGWWKGGMQLHLVVSREKYDALPKPYQAALRAAAAIADSAMLAHYDAANPAAVKRLVVGGATLRLFPQDVLEACYKAASDIYDQLSADDPRFKKIADSFLAFRGDEYLWWQVAEYSFDNFMIRQRHAKT